MCASALTQVQRSMLDRSARDARLKGSSKLTDTEDRFYHMSDPEDHYKTSPVVRFRFQSVTVTVKPVALFSVSVPEIGGGDFPIFSST